MDQKMLNIGFGMNRAGIINNTSIQMLRSCKKKKHGKHSASALVINLIVSQHFSYLGFSCRVCETVAICISCH